MSCLDLTTIRAYYMILLKSLQRRTHMSTITRWEPFRGMPALQEQVNRLFEDTFFRGRADESAITTWAPAVDIYETKDDLVVKADLPDVRSEERRVGKECR